MAAKSQFKLVVEGWRQLSHSYALVNQWQLLALARRTGFTLHHRDVALFDSRWQPMRGLFPADAEAALARLGPPSADAPPVDATLRLAFPYNFAPVETGTLAVFATAECGVCPPGSLAGHERRTLADALDAAQARIITLSAWSRRGFLRSGAPAEAIHVVPHGVAPELYHPLDHDARRALRETFGWAEDSLVVLNIGALSPNKGTMLLLQAFARVAAAHPTARLVIKYNASLYRPDEFLAAARRTCTPAEQQLLATRIQLIGGHHTLTDMARLYQAADVYATPYHAEGFNLPALEACACGLPVLATAGGPTDEYLPAGVLHRIASREEHRQRDGQDMIVLMPELDDLVRKLDGVLADPAARAAARIAGPAHVQAGYTWDHVVSRLLSALGASHF